MLHAPCLWPALCKQDVAEGRGEGGFPHDPEFSPSLFTPCSLLCRAIYSVRYINDRRGASTSAVQGQILGNDLLFNKLHVLFNVCCYGNHTGSPTLLSTLLTDKIGYLSKHRKCYQKSIFSMRPQGAPSLYTVLSRTLSPAHSGLHVTSGPTCSPQSSL